MKITVDIRKGKKFLRKPFISNFWVRAEVRDKLLHPPFLDPFRFRVSKTLTMYVYRRKKIGLEATQRWGDSLPKFNCPDTKQQPTEFATRINSECGIPEVNFNADGIARHFQNFFTEQRRYRKIKTTSCKVCFSTCTWFWQGLINVCPWKLLVNATFAQLSDCFVFLLLLWNIYLNWG